MEANSTMDNNNYVIADRTKKIVYALIAIGVVGLIWGMFIHPAGSQRIWANVLVNSFFFLGIGAAALFFLTLQYATESHYAVPVKRVVEALTGYLPVGALFLVIVLAAGALHLHHLYHWMEPGIAVKGSENYDKVIAAKSPYLNQTFFWIRTLAYLGIWIAYQRLFRKRSLAEDMEGGLNIHNSNIKSAAIFLILYGVSSSASAWDWLMSIDAHWFSTMFGWYVFSGTWVSAMIMLILFVLYLKRKGYLHQVNENHIHDIGKWMFAVSVLWTYLWFCQFMLIWYADIPEEVTYFKARFEDYKPVMWTMFFVNFALPTIFLIARDAKRNYGYLTFVGCVIFFFHWVDVYQIVMPGTVGANWKFFSPLELGMFCGFLGVFLLVVHTQLAKAPLMVKSHPYLEEGLHHEF